MTVEVSVNFPFLTCLSLLVAGLEDFSNIFRLTCFSHKQFKDTPQLLNAN